MLRRVPAADLAIRVDAPEEVIERRLASREEGLGWIGTLFESRDSDVLGHGRVTRMLFEQLKRLGRATISVDCGDAASLDTDLARAIDAIAAREAQGVRSSSQLGEGQRTCAAA
jgi:hypothetical protein